MAYDGKLLARARASLENTKNINESEHNRRIALIYTKIPEIEKIDFRLSNQWRQLAGFAVSNSPDKSKNISALRDENLSLQMRKAELLVENGFPSDYLDEIYSCPLCHDTGTTQNGVCSCLKKLYKNELSRELSPLLRNGNESFEHFDLNLYSSEYSGQYGCIPREYMKAIYNACSAFASAFPNVEANLLFSGASGLGKTFLSGCIAKAVSEKGYSVCYDSASSAFDSFERRKFSRNPEEQEAAELRTSRMLECDLMILDDLGTELVTSASLNALYTLINTRINSGKLMIISTNLSPDELRGKYTEAICSRIDGEFYTLKFCGSDIRQILKERK